VQLFGEVGLDRGLSLTREHRCGQETQEQGDNEKGRHVAEGY